MASPNIASRIVDLFASTNYHQRWFIKQQDSKVQRPNHASPLIVAEDYGEDSPHFSQENQVPLVLL